MGLRALPEAPGGIVGQQLRCVVELERRGLRVAGVLKARILVHAEIPVVVFYRDERQKSVDVDQDGSQNGLPFRTPPSGNPVIGIRAAMDDVTTTFLILAARSASLSKVVVPLTAGMK